MACRLPSSAEFAAGGPTMENANLADATWRRQRDHVKRYNLSMNLESEFYPPPAGDEGHEAADTTAGGDDGFLWFREVGEGKDTAFHDLVGNVAEFVCDQAPRADDPPVEPIVAAVEAKSKERADKLAVMAGSALTPAGKDLLAPQVLKDVNKGYADVGFRLAFTAPRQSMSTQLQQLFTRDGEAVARFLAQP